MSVWKIPCKHKYQTAVFAILFTMGFQRIWDISDRSKHGQKVWNEKRKRKNWAQSWWWHSYVMDYLENSAMYDSNLFHSKSAHLAFFLSHQKLPALNLWCCSEKNPVFKSDKTDKLLKCVFFLFFFGEVALNQQLLKSQLSWVHQ